MHHQSLQESSQAAIPACFLNSLPKSGTHLLAKAVGLLPGTDPSGLHLGRDGWSRFSHSHQTAALLPMGVGSPVMISPASLSRRLKKLHPGHFATGHVPFSTEASLIFSDMRIKTFLLLRDPRDVVVSHAKYVAATSDHHLFVHYQRLSEHERITTSILGLHDSFGHRISLGIREQLEAILPWMSQSSNHTTYFERLVGPQGGGSLEEQIQGLHDICQHLSIFCTVDELEAIARRVFGGSATFRRGVIGGWREYFTDNHRQLCKDLIGQQLVDLGYERDVEW